MAVKTAQPQAARGGRYDDAEIPVSPEVIPRDRWGRPLIPLRADPAGERIPRTRSSGFGKYLEDAEGIAKWGQGIVAIGVGRSESLQLQAVALGASDIEDREVKGDLAKLRDSAYELGGGNDGWRKGQALHSITDRIDIGDEPGDEVPRDFRPILDRYRELMSGFEVLATEVFGANDRWLTAGTFDFLLRLRGWLVAPDGTALPPGTVIMGDKKTSGTSRYFGCKFCVQLKTYATNEPIDKATGRYITWESLGGRPDQRWALILHFSSDPRKVGEAGWHWVDLAAGEALCDLSAAIRAAMKTKPITPCAKLPVAQHPDDVRRAGALSKIAGAGSIAALKLIARSHRAVWDDELRAAARARADEISTRQGFDAETA